MASHLTKKTHRLGYSEKPAEESRKQQQQQHDEKKVGEFYNGGICGFFCLLSDQAGI